MNADKFGAIVNWRLSKIKSMLASKGEEYAGEQKDRLHNFKRAAAMLQSTPEAALLGMFSKHMISILDITDALPGRVADQSVVQEKIGDAINYLILLEALINERNEKEIV